MSNIALINKYARERGVDRTKMWRVVATTQFSLFLN
jgi:hypothetical protein